MNMIDRIAASQKRKKDGIETPWGRSQSVRQLAQGILRVDTAGHGGYFVADELLHLIPKAHRQWAARWSGSENWYEEDCCWAAVCLAFPTLFDEAAWKAAQRVVSEYVK